MIKVGSNVKKSLSWKYLLPILKGDKKLWSYLETNLIRRVGVYDVNSPISFFPRNLYIQIRYQGNENHARNLRDYVVNVVKGFSYKSNPNEITLIIKLRKEFKGSYDEFLEGNYDQMFEQDDIENLFSEDNQESERGVLERDETSVAGVNFKDSLVRHFYDSVDQIKGLVLELDQLEFKPSPQKEIFNFKGSERDFKNINYAEF